MADHTLVNLKEVENAAPRFGFPPGLEARFATKELKLEQSGASYMRYGPNFRVPFGHKHHEQEEVYVLISGSARLKVEDEILELNQWDAVRVPGESMRCFEGGPEGAEVVAFGAPHAGPSPADEVEAEPGWWSD